MDARYMLFDECNTHQTPLQSPSSSPQWLYSPRLPPFPPPVSTPSRKSSVEPHSEDFSPTGRRIHHSELAFIRPHDIDRGLTPGLSALLQETICTNWRDQPKQEPDRLSAVCIELLSRPFGGKL